MTPAQLYELWERQNWASHEIDFTQDRRDWEAMSDVEREDGIVGPGRRSSSARSASPRSSAAS